MYCGDKQKSAKADFCSKHYPLSDYFAEATIWLYIETTEALVADV